MAHRVLTYGSWIVLLVGCLLGASAIAEVNSRPIRLVVGSETDYPPYALLDKDGLPDGFSIDLVKAVGAAINADLTFRIGPWSKVKESLEKGQVDLLPHVYHSPERDAVFDFSVTHTIANGAFFVRQGEFSRMALDDLKGLSVIAMRDDWTHEFLVAEGLAPKITPVETVSEALKLLAEGKGNLAFLPHLVGVLVAGDLGLDHVGTVGDLIPVGKGFAFAVREGDAELLRKLNDGLALVKATGEYDRIFEKWFGVVNFPEPPYWNTRRLVFFIAIPMGVILILLVAWRYHTVLILNAKLENRVRQRTAELEREKGRAETYLDLAGAIIVATDVTSRILMINRRGAALLGWSEETLIHRDWLEGFVAEVDRARARWRMGQVLSGELPALDGLELLIQTREGGERLTSWNVTALYDHDTGALTGCLCAGEDITERRAAERELLTTKQRLEDVLESMTDIVVLYDRNQNYLLSNQSYKEVDPRIAAMLKPGLHVSEVASALIRFGLWVVPEGEQELAIARRVEEVRNASGNYEMEDGNGRLFLVKDHRTHEGGTLVTRTDITERKQAEQRLFHAQKMEALGSLSGGVAHSLNNLLTPIMALANVVLSELPEKGDARASMDRIAQATLKARDLVRGILAFSRADIADMQRQDLHVLISGAVDLIREVIPKTIQFSATLDSDVGFVLADRSQIETVTMNIVNNAVAALEGAPHGRIDVTLGRVSISDLAEEEGMDASLPVGRYARLSVVDNGPGIDPRIQSRIFDPFFTTKAVGKGTGLGLSMALGVIEKHGGAIHVHSRLGEGTRFDVFLPLEDLV